MTRSIITAVVGVAVAAGIGMGIGGHQPKPVGALAPLPIDTAFEKATTVKELNEALLNDPTYKKAINAALKAKRDQEEFFRKNKGAVGSSPAQAARVAFLAVLTGEKGDSDEQPIKADVVIKSEDKDGRAKAGQMVGIDIQYAVAPPFPGDFKLIIDGKAVKADTRVTPVLANGRPVVGVQNTTVYFKAEGTGKQKIVVDYKKGTEVLKREVELEVVP